MNHPDVLSTAARLVVEEGMEYAQAKRRAIRHLGLPERTALPDNDALEDAVREHIALFHADTQPAELAALRRVALKWMQAFSEFRPHLGGAVWHGTATRHSSVHVWLFCDDPKSAEIELINRGQRYDVGATRGLGAHEVPVLTVHDRWPRPDLAPAQGQSTKAPGEWVGIHLLVHDADDLRGALKADARGRPARGNLHAVLALLQDPTSLAPSPEPRAPIR